MARKTDSYVGRRIRHRRWIVGISQMELAERAGVRFQQIQKYETGSNRVSASKLWEISRALNIPVEYLFEGLGRDRGAAVLVTSYYSLNAEQRKALLMCFSFPREAAIISSSQSSATDRYLDHVRFAVVAWRDDCLRLCYSDVGK